MKITIKYSAQIAQAADASSETVELEAPCTVRELVERIAKERGGRFRDLVLGGEGKPVVLLAVGDEQVRWEDERRLREGDEVSLLSPISGG